MSSEGDFSGQFWLNMFIKMSEKAKVSDIYFDSPFKSGFHTASRNVLLALVFRWQMSSLVKQMFTGHYALW